MKFLIVLILSIFIFSACTPRPESDDSIRAGKQADLPLSGGGPAVEEKVYHPISIDAMIDKEFIGNEFTVGRVLASNENYTRYYITYMSGELKISGIMNVPKGEGQWPLLILNHGYIDPAIYTNGRGLKREQDYLARRGYVVVHIDYRNHAQSDKVEGVEQRFRLGYTEDAINAINAVRAAGLDYVDAENVGMLGHSMGGGVTLNTLVIWPDLVDAAVLFAPVSADSKYNFEKWTRQRHELAEEIEDVHGTPETNPDFWAGVSPKNYFDRIVTPILNHHGTADESVPLWWSDELEGWLNDEGIDNMYYIYQGERHEFGSAWPLVMQRTVDFFDEYLK